MKTSSQKVHESIRLEKMKVRDPLGTPCEWCGRPMERGETAWYAENDHADALGCSKACARSTVFGRTPR